MKKIILLFIGCSIFFKANCQNMDNHTWKNRILIVKTTCENSGIYQTQLDEFLNQNEELKDRKLVIYQVNGSEYKLIDYNNINQIKTGELSSFTKEILNDEKEFEVILIGFDGGIKLRKTDLVTKEELFSKIDAMSMRKAEIRSRKTKN